MILSAAVLPAAAEDAPLFSVNLCGNAEDSIDTVKTWYCEADGKHYLFLPGGTDASQAAAYFSGALSVDGRELTNGGRTDVFASAGDKKVVSDGKEYTLCVMQSANIPAVFISTESGNLDYIHANKNNKEKGNIRVFENGEVTLDSPLKQIKGRGNSTWAYEKKPYNIKFDEKTDLFGMGKAKKWSLLASATDSSLVRNKISYGLAEAAGLDFTPSMTHVDMYINGEYRGNFLVVESIEVGKTRVAIENLADANEEANPGTDVEKCELKREVYGDGLLHYADIPNDPDDITGGYLLEFDTYNRWNAEVSGFETNNGQCVTVNTPEYASRAEVRYVADLWQQAEDAILSPDGKNALGRHYSDYLDMDSFVKMYIVQEFCKNVDSAMSSFYIYKEKGEDTKFVASPIWDFDFALGHGVKKLGMSTSAVDKWFANCNYYPEDKYQKEIGTIYTYLWKQADFRALIADGWAEFKNCVGDAEYEYIDSLRDTLAASAVMNGFRWNYWDKKTTGQEKADAYANDITAIEKFMKSRTGYLDNGFSENNAMIFYDSNGGTGRVIHEKFQVKGDSVTVMGNDKDGMTMKKNGCAFVGWNTKADGSGESFAPGDEIALTDDILTLYAVWERVNSADGIALKGGFVCSSAALSAEKLRAFFADEIAVSAASDGFVTTGDTVTAEGRSYTVAVMGDTDCDGAVTANDARLVLRFAAELGELTEAQKKAADVTSDGNVRANDARAVLRIAADIDPVPAV